MQIDVRLWLRYIFSEWLSRFSDASTSLLLIFKIVQQVSGDDSRDTFDSLESRYLGKKSHSVFIPRRISGCAITCSPPESSLLPSCFPTRCCNVFSARRVLLVSSWTLENMKHVRHYQRAYFKKGKTVVFLIREKILYNDTFRLFVFQPRAFEPLLRWGGCPGGRCSVKIKTKIKKCIFED